MQSVADVNILPCIIPMHHSGVHTAFMRLAGLCPHVVHELMFVIVLTVIVLHPAYASSTNTRSLLMQDDTASAAEASDESFVRHLSKGWFPQPYALTHVGIMSALPLYVYEGVSNLRSTSFAPTKTAFNTTWPYASDQDAFKEKFSSQDATPDDFSAGYGSRGLIWAKSIPALWCIVRAHALYDRSTTRLYAEDNSKQFLRFDGTLQSIKEVNVLNVTQDRCNLGASLILPVYGIYVSSELADVSSLYFVAMGVNSSLLLRSSARQYTHIASPKEEVRFSNGTDTVNVRAETDIQTMNNTQYSLTVSGGWMAGLQGSLFVTVEPFATIPLSSVLGDAPWYQWYAGVRFSFGYERQ